MCKLVYDFQACFDAESIARKGLQFLNAISKEKEMVKMMTSGMSASDEDICQGMVENCGRQDGERETLRGNSEDDFQERNWKTAYVPRTRKLRLDARLELNFI